MWCKCWNIFEWSLASILLTIASGMGKALARPFFVKKKKKRLMLTWVKLDLKFLIEANSPKYNLNIQAMHILNARSKV